MSSDLTATWAELAEVDSTNAEAFRRAPDLRGPLWILAAAQTAGRGRRARPWVSPPGNFYASLVQVIDEPPARLGLRSFIASLALYDAFQAVAPGLSDQPGTGFALKWPNDVLLNGRKLTGILLEAQGKVLVTGIGVNLLHAPPAAALEPGAVAPASLWEETGLRVTPQRFLAQLAPAMAGWEGRFRREGFAPLREAWLSRAARIGERIIARTGALSREGIFESIDEEGNLLLRDGSGLSAIPAADVFF